MHEWNELLEKVGEIYEQKVHQSKIKFVVEIASNALSFLCS